MVQRANVLWITTGLMSALFFADVAVAQWHYYYFDKPRALTLDTTKVALLLSDDYRLPEVKNSLRAQSLDPERLTLTVFPKLAKMTIAGHDAESIQILVAALSNIDGVDSSSPVFLNHRGDPVIITRTLLVGFNEGTDAQQAEAILRQEGAGRIEVRNWSRMPRVYKITSNSRDGFEVLKSANRLALRPEVTFAEPDMIMTERFDHIPNDPAFLSSWGLHNIGQSGGVADMDMDAPEAWDITTGDPGIIVAVMDDGVQQDHPDLNLIPGFDVTGQGGGGGHINECDSHGTLVSGCISALIDNGLGSTGICPECKVVPIRFGISNVPCDGTFSVLSSWLVDALDIAQTVGARVTNNSTTFGSTSAHRTKYEQTREAGLVHFTSAGNGGNGSIGPPGSFEAVNAVAALTRNGTRASFSQFGEGLAFSAPGQSIFTTAVGSNYAIVDGTSFSSPYAAGVAALLLSATPTLSSAEVEDILKNTSVDLGAEGYDTNFGYGFINAHNALRRVFGGILSCQIEELVAHDAAEDAEYGVALAMSGDVALVGARSENCSAGARCGTAYVYRWDGVTWNLEEKLIADQPGELDFFGNTVALRQDVAVVGSAFDDVGLDVNVGTSSVFRYNGVNWINEQTLEANDASADDRFGTAVSIGNDVILVGARNENNTSANDGTGAAYMFAFDGDSWNQTHKLTASDAAPFAEFGASAVISDGVAMVGSPGTSCPAGFECGTVYIYEFDGVNWPEVQKLEPADRVEGDNFGFSMAIDQDTLLVGSPFAPCEAGGLCGAIYVYERLGGTWIQTGKIKAFDADALDFFGASVAIKGPTALVGAYADDCLGALNCGTAYVLRRSDSEWFVDAKLGDASLLAVDHFGWAVALSDTLAMIGARLRDSLSLNNSGAVFSYAVAPDCNLNATADTCDILSGFSLDLDEDGQPDECLCDPASVVQIDTLGSRNRFLSFTAGDPGLLQSIRVQMDDLPPPFDGFNGSSLWVGEPIEISENSGTIEPASAPKSPTSWVAGLQCDPRLRDWSDIPLLNVYHQLIVPGGSYNVQVISDGCDLLNLDHYSAPRILTTSAWGDVVSDCTTIPCGPADGTVNVTTDVTSVLDKFKNVPAGPVKSRTDVEPGLIDFTINISDVTQVLNAFSSLPYPFGLSGWIPCP